VRDEINEWRNRQEQRWSEQLASVEKVEAARAHDFPVRLLLKAPADVVRYQLERQAVTPEELIAYSRFDLLTPQQLENVHEVGLRDDQAEAVDTDTLINMYTSIKGKPMNRFVVQLMAHGRVGVLMNIAVPDDINIFDAQYTDLDDARKTILWAQSKGMSWGAAPNVEDKVLRSLLKSFGAAV